MTRNERIAAELGDARRHLYAAYDLAKANTELAELCRLLAELTNAVDNNAAGLQRIEPRRGFLARVVADE